MFGVRTAVLVWCWLVEMGLRTVRFAFFMAAFLIYGDGGFLPCNKIQSK